MLYKKVCNYQARRRHATQQQAKHDAKWRPILSLFSLKNRAGEIPMPYDDLTLLKYFKVQISRSYNFISLRIRHKTLENQTLL